MSVRILEGDALTVLRTLPDQSVQCCVTSPPYFGLRDYGVVGQLGLEKTPQLYVDAMVAVFSEVKRVLRDDGTLWLNIGDSYAGVRGNTANAPGFDGKAAQGHASLDYGGRGKRPVGDIKSKDLIGIPWMLAFALRADGWYLRSDIIEEVELYCPCGCGFVLEERIWRHSPDREIIWKKPNPMPESVTDRPTKSHEYLFLLSKSPTYYYDADAIAETLTESSVVRLSQPSIDDQMGSDRVPGKTNGRIKAVAGPSWKERKAAGATAGNIGASDTYQRGVHGDGLSHDLGTPGQRNKRSVWTVTTQPFRSAHFATFPPKLIEPCILAGSAKQACEKCDAPWERISGREKQPEAYADQKYDTANPLHATKRNMGARYQAELNANPKLTLGFKPTCDCENGGTASSLVLDPFGGAGTTGLVADRLGRDALLIELNPKYAEMARKRIHSDNPLFTDVA